MTTVQAVSLFACMYAALVIVAELVYMVLDDLRFWRRYCKREKQYEKEWHELILGKQSGRTRR